MGKELIIFDFFGVISSEVFPIWAEKYFSLNEIKFIKNFQYDEPICGFNKIHGDALLNYYKSLLNHKILQDLFLYFQYHYLQYNFQ